MSKPIPVKVLIEHAIYLCTEKGKALQLEGAPGIVMQYDSADFSVLYTTPFSGVEVYPGMKRYIIDIWYKNKKVFNHDFSSLDDIEDGKSKRAEWVYTFMEIV